MLLSPDKLFLQCFTLMYLNRCSSLRVAENFEDGSRQPMSRQKRRYMPVRHGFFAYSKERSKGTRYPCAKLGYSITSKNWKSRYKCGNKSSLARILESHL